MPCNGHQNWLDKYLIDTLGVNILWNMLAGKSVIRIEKGTVRARKRTMKIKAGHLFDATSAFE